MFPLLNKATDGAYLIFLDKLLIESLTLVYEIEYNWIFSWLINSSKIGLNCEQEIQPGR